MITARSFVFISWCFFAAAAFSQSVPIRLLDSNGAFTSDQPVRVRSDIAVGNGTANGRTTASEWTGAGSDVLAPLLGNQTSSAADFNLLGDIVGSSVKSIVFASTATLWRADTPINLNSLVGGGAPLYLSTATAIDAHGRIAGGGAPSKLALPDAGYLFDGGMVTDLGALVTGAAGMSPLRMNDYLQIVGSADSGSGVLHAALWDNGTLQDLHDPAQISGTTSTARAINRFGRICGDAGFLVSGASERQSAVLWDQGVVTDLGANAPSPSMANGLNDFGEVVGTYYDAILGNRACIFENGGATDLNNLLAPATGWTLEVATDVDDEGRIVGTGDFGGETRAFILEPNAIGSFTIYGTGSSGSLGVEPRLDGVGWPSPGRDFALFLHDGMANQLGFFFVGASNGVLPVKTGVDLQVVPLALPPFLIQLDGHGESWSSANLQNGTPIFDLFLQGIFLVPGSNLLTSTKPLHLHFE